MIKLLLDDTAGISGVTIKLLILIVTGVVLLDRVKKCDKLEPQQAPPQAPAPIPQKQAAMGFWGTLFGLFMNIFVRRASPGK